MGNFEISLKTFGNAFKLYVYKQYTSSICLISLLERNLQFRRKPNLYLRDFIPTTSYDQFRTMSKNNSNNIQDRNFKIKNFLKPILKRHIGEGFKI